MLVSVAMLLVVACAQPGLSEQARLDAFLADANASPQDPDALRSNFSTKVSSYDSLNTADFWNNSYFAAGGQPFDVTGETLGGAHSDFAGSTTIAGTISNGIPSTASATFVFVANPAADITDGHLIRAIIIGDSGSVEDIRSIVDLDVSVEDDSEGWQLR